MSFPQHLLDGYRAFLDSRLPREQDRYRELAEAGQAPEVMVIGCCDSRVSPEVIFDARPGELFSWALGSDRSWALGSDRVSSSSKPLRGRI